jgi:hypothetical protein
MFPEPDSILSSSVSLVIDNHHWFRQTHGDNITWIPMFADYYYAYRAVEKQWWYVDEEKKFKVDAVPDTEIIYWNLVIPKQEPSLPKPEVDFQIITPAYCRKISNIQYYNFACRHKGVYWVRHWELFRGNVNFVRWHSSETSVEYFFSLNDKFQNVWHTKSEPEAEFVEIKEIPDIELQYQAIYQETKKP